MGPTTIRFNLKTKTEILRNEYDNLVPTSQKTTSIFIIRTSLLILCKEIIVIGSKIHTEQKRVDNMQSF
jgi:hypothetical protein